MNQAPRRLHRRTSRSVSLDYLLALPDGYDGDPSRRWPLVLFLHGAGERGSDLSLVMKHGIPRRVEEGAQFPFIAVSPQCPTDERWASVRHVLSLTALLDDIQSHERVDGDRVYVTGLSMGGFGTWMLAAEHPRRFAAIAPICGGGDPSWSRVLAHLPIWVFHGAKDQTVPLARSEQMVEALKSRGGDPKFTVYPDAAHDSWTATYKNPAFYDWLLAQRRGQPTAGAPGAAGAAGEAGARR